MGRGAIPLSFWDLLLATSLILIAGLVSFVLRLGMGRKLALAAVRTVVQLLLVGQVLSWVFSVDSPWILLGLIGVMVAAAARAAIDRPSRTFSGAYFGALVTLASTGLVITFFSTSLVVGIEPWYHAQYVIPLLGMVLGNTLTGLSLAIDHLLQSLDQNRELVETELALGASRWEAVREPLAEAVRKGMIPIVNMMMVVGIVSLPGMMTGQILEGADPLDAVKYQVVIMFMLAAAVALGSIFMGLFIYRRLFNERHQLVQGAIRLRS